MTNDSPGRTAIALVRARMEGNREAESDLVEMDSDPVHLAGTVNAVLDIAVDCMVLLAAGDKDRAQSWLKQLALRAAIDET